MNLKICLASILIAVASAPAVAQEHRVAGNLDALVAKHSSAYGVPETLIRRVIKRESGGRPRVISKGNYGLMQIRLGTARAMGYRGGVEGLLDADTNMTYAVKYLAGAYRLARGNHDQSIRYYAAGYYYAAKRQGVLAKNHPNPIGAFAASVARGTTPDVKVASAPAETVGQKPSEPAEVLDPVEKVADARDEGKNVTSGSDLYTGRLDYF